MSSTEAPNIASTGSMSSTYPRVQAVPAVSSCEILGVLRVSRVLNPEILRAHTKYLKYFFSKILSLYYQVIKASVKCEML